MRLALFEPDIPAEYRRPAALGRLSRRCRRHHRALRLPLERPAPETRRHGLSDGSGALPACELDSLHRPATWPAGAADDAGDPALSPLRLSRPTTRCFWGARAPACRRRCIARRMRASSFPCARGSARSTWHWPPRWCWARRCGSSRPFRARWRNERGPGGDARRDGSRSSATAFARPSRRSSRIMRPSARKKVPPGASSGAPGSATAAAAGRWR